MLQQAQDFLDEGRELHALLGELGAADYAHPTPFKNWTVNDVVWHLHYGDFLAVQSLTDPDRFQEIVAFRKEARERGASREEQESMGPERVSGEALREQWWAYLQKLAGLLGAADPDARLKWVGPDMGVRMFTTARQMETWAHGQDIYDLLRKPRVYTDRLKNIAVIGVKTFGWTFVNRGLTPPEPVPYVRLTAPSGAIWEWNEPSEDCKVEGDAAEFCHVVSQGRNIADTDLTVVGGSAVSWMAIAQCFAGPPEEPPAPGARTGKA